MVMDVLIYTLNPPKNKLVSFTKCAHQLKFLVFKFILRERSEGCLNFPFRATRRLLLIKYGYMTD